MSVVVRAAAHIDHPAILDLAARSRGEGLTAQQRAERGFIQGLLDEAALVAREQGEGAVVVAVQDDQLAGFALASLPGSFGGPPGMLMKFLLDHGVSTDTLFLYGPVAVDPVYQGRGVMRELLAALSTSMIERGRDRGAAFVELANERSLATHRHLGMAESGTFSFGDREYAVLQFDASQFTR